MALAHVCERGCNDGVGASGFLLKDTQPAELLRALRVVMRGESLLSPAVTRRLISEFVARPPDAGRTRAEQR